MDFFALSVQDMLRLRDAAAVAWAVFDPEWYLAAYPAAAATIDDRSPAGILRFYLDHGQKQRHSPNIYFDEAWHLQTYPRAAAAVRDGLAASAFDAYCREGFHGRSPHWLFDEVYYRTHTADLDEAALRRAGVANGYDHFLRFGQREGRSGHALFDPAVYLHQLATPGVRDAAAPEPFTHYLRQLDAGWAEPRTTVYFDPVWYRDTFAAAVRSDTCALRHYLCNDTPANFNPVPAFSESFYQTRNNDAVAAVASGRFRNGYAHFLSVGIRELRAPNATIDLAVHASVDQVARDIREGRAADAFAHFLQFGETITAPPVKPERPPVTDDQAETLFRRRVQAQLPAIAWHGLDFTCQGKPDLSVIMVLQDEFAMALATLGSLRQNYAGAIELVLVDSGAGGEIRYVDWYITGARLLRFDDDIGAASGFNAGENFVSSDVVLCLDAGMELAPGSIDAAMRRLSTDPQTGAVGGRIIGPRAVLCQAGIIVWRDATATDYLHGASAVDPAANFVRRVDACSGFLMVRGPLLRQLGGYDTDFGTARYAAMDLCIRIAAGGYAVIFDPGVTVYRYRDTVEPPDDGQARAAFQRKHAALLRFRYIPDERVEVFARFSGNSGRRVLFIEDTVPLRLIGSGFVRSNDILCAMASLGFQVTVLPVLRNTFNLARIHADIPDSVELMHDLSIEDLAKFLGSRPGYYDVFWVARTHNLNGVRSVLEPTIVGTGRPPMVVLDTEAVGATRDAMRAEILGEPAVDLDAAILREMARADLCQSIIVVSRQEAARLTALGFPDVAVIGHMREGQPTPKSFERRAGMLFVGAIHRMDSPNYDGLCWFVDHVLPLVEESLGWETRLTVIGFIGDDVNLDRFRYHPRVVLRGSVAQTAPAYDQHRLFIAPTRFAAGAPYKLYEAASYGLPIVATQLLADQMEWTDGEELLTADATDPARFAERIVTLYRDEALWSRLRTHALARLEQENGWETYVASVRAVVGTGESPLRQAAPRPSPVASG
jgi:glycosyltransferase involved in cell wall biosynthesis